MISPKIRSEIIHYCKRMDKKEWVANHDGNITVRLSPHSIAATPTARAKADLKEEDLIEVDETGKKTAGTGNPFSELAVHLRILKARPDVRAVVHSHAPYAMAVGSAEQEMLTWAIPEAIISLGPGVPLIPFCMPQSDAFMNELTPLLAYYDAVLVSGNGIFSWGQNLEQAFLRHELVEHLAKIFILSLPLGGPKMLEPAQVGELLKKRINAGLALPPDPSRPTWFPGFQAGMG